MFLVSIGIAFLLLGGVLLVIFLQYALSTHFVAGSPDLL